jgi:hypothetical protein
MHNVNRRKAQRYIRVETYALKIFQTQQFERGRSNLKVGICNAIFHSRDVNFSRNRPFYISTPTFYSWSNNTIHPRKHIGKLPPSTDLSPPPLERAFKALLSIVCMGYIGMPFCICCVYCRQKLNYQLF